VTEDRMDRATIKEMLAEWDKAALPAPAGEVK
jgi:hypothetical protein